MENIRNFCIIAHIDHGKSTLADRLLQTTGTVSDRDMKEQTLDDMDIERERGITIKSHAIQMKYKRDGIEYTLNLIDTPGHVDFSYEVSRSIAACEGALLIVDAAQGIQAQTISNLYLALDHELEIIPVLNKMDLPGAEPEDVKDQIEELILCDRDGIIPASGKTGMGVLDILNAVIDRVPPPKGNPKAALKALIFDSVFNPFRGIIAYYRIIDGELNKRDQIKFMNTGKSYYAEEIGVLKLKPEIRQTVKTGDVGYIICSIKEAKEVKVGDTITITQNPTEIAIDGFEDVKPMVFAGIFPVDTEDFEELRDSMAKLQLNDASLVFEPESSAALGFGFRCGFLGMLHMEIIQERLEREFGMTVITTVPNVSYHAYLKKDPDNIVVVNNPTDLPEPNYYDRLEEPYINAQIITAGDYVGSIMSLCIEKRGAIINQVYLTSNRVELTFEMPMAEVVFDFYDKLKSVSRGYASFDYHPIGYRESQLVKLDILLNAKVVDALSAVIHRDKAYSFGKKICEKLRELIPRHQFEIPIQAAIGAKVISRENIRAMRKLLEKQKKGKKRMRQVGNVEIPQSAFMAVLKID